MDKLETIFKLIDAGYTKEEISQLMSPADPKPEQPEPEQPEQPKPEQSEQPEKPAQLPDDFMKQLNDTLANMNSTLQSIQTANIRNSTAPQSAEPLDIAKDILAEVIAPKQKGKTK